MVKRESDIYGVGHRTDTGDGVDQFEVTVVIERHGGEAVAWSASRACLDAQFLESVSELAGTLVPLTPGKSEVFTFVVSIDNANIIGIDTDGRFHEGGEK
jgi:hypothetical protein